MNDYLHQLYYSRIGWLCIKIFLSFFWLIEMLGMVSSTSHISLPVGVCAIIPCDWLQNIFFKVAIIFACFLALCFYLFSKKHLTLTLSCLFLLSVLIISAHESSGVFNRANLFSMVWFGQLLAAIVYRNNIEKMRIYRHQYVVQIVGATYFLAAISKLIDAGLDWPTQGAEYISINGLKGYYFHYFDNGNSQVLQFGTAIAYTLLEHKELVYWSLICALFIELTAPLAAISVKTTFVYGVAFLLLHLGIDYTMNIVIEGTYFTMLAFMLNPLGIIFFLYKDIKKRGSSLFLRKES
jgi:hypothetical protein